MYVELIRSKALISGYKPMSEHDIARLNYTKLLFNHELERLKNDETANRNNGLFGDIFEILSRRSDDERVRVATQNRRDATVLVDGQLYNAELKSQLGRIGFLQDNGTDSINAEYVIYKCFLPCQRNGEKYERPSKTVIMTIQQFNEAVDTIATTSVHKNGEKFIRVNTKWYNYINSCIEYDRTKEYKAIEFK